MKIEEKRKGRWWKRNKEENGTGENKENKEKGEEWEREKEED